MMHSLCQSRAGMQFCSSCQHHTERRLHQHGYGAPGVVMGDSCQSRSRNHLITASRETRVTQAFAHGKHVKGEGEAN